MKKIASTLIIFLLLINWFGYHLVVNYLQQKSDTHLEASLDNNQYDNTQLIELKIPIDVAYQTTWAEFERYDGEIEMNGILYKYVKRKLYNDTLYLMCIPNIKKMELETARFDLIKNTNDLTQGNSSHRCDKSANSLKYLSVEYDAYSCRFNLTKRDRNFQKFEFTNQLVCLPTSPHISPGQPPDLLLI